MERFTLYCFVTAGKGKWERVDNLREKTPTGSRSISDTRTGIVYQNQKECAKAIEALNLAEMDRMLALRAAA